MHFLNLILLVDKPHLDSAKQKEFLRFRILSNNFDTFKILFFLWISRTLLKTAFVICNS